MKRGVVDSKTLTYINEVINKQGPGHERTLATRAVMMALASTPLVVLDVNYDFLTYKGLKGNSLRWAQLVAVSER